MPRHFAFTLSLLACMASSVTAQTAPDPKADLAALDARAATDPQLQAFWNSLRNRLARPDRPTSEQLMRMAGEIREGFPVQYRLERQIKLAMARAQFAAEILRSDLDGDWQVTREELVASLSGSGRGQGGAAEAFVLGDKDGNDILDTAEIQRAAGGLESRSGGEMGRNSFARLFDFDDDGVLTQAEYDRGLAALQS